MRSLELLLGKDKNTDSQSVLVLSIKVLIAVVVIIAIVGFGGYEFLSYQTQTQLDSRSAEPQERASSQVLSVSTSPVLALRSGSFHRDDGGFIITEGQVTNLSDESLAGVIAVVDFRKDDQLVKSRRAMIAFNPLLPGQTSPFMIKTSENPRINVADITFETASGELIQISDVREQTSGLPLTVPEEFKLELQESVFTLEEVVQQGKAKPHSRGTLFFLVADGEVTNVSSESLKNVVAVATFYSADEKFVKWAWAPIDIDPLLPGQTSNFRVVAIEDPGATRVFVEFQHLDGKAIATLRPENERFSVAVLTSSTAIPVDAEPEILILNQQLQPDGRLSRIVGELQNTGPNVLRNVTLGITIHTGAGSPLLAELTPSIVSLTGHPYIETLLPGQKSPFEFLYTGLAYSVTDVQILNYTIAEGSPYQSLRLNDVSANFEPGEIKSPSSQDPYARFYGPISSFHVTGIVDNEGFSTVKNVRIVVTFYDKDGVMVDGVFWFSDPSKLKPNQTGDFEIVTRVRADEVATFIVQYAAQAAAN